MKLLDMEKKLSELPTIMSISDEITLIKSLMNVPFDNLNKDSFFKIINALELAHTDNGFMELNYENEHVFKEFADWLFKLKHECHFNIDKNTIENFSLTVEDVKRLMP